MNTLFARFTNPPNQYRSLPFWAWNDALTSEELVRQIHNLKEQGFGGFFMHSREGLETPYLSPQWDHCIQICVKTAEKLGMEAWLYDEDRWPSGSCGGQVTAIEENKHALKGLTLSVQKEVPKDLESEPCIRALYSANIEGDALYSFHRLDTKQPIVLKEGASLLIVRFETSKGSVWFNGSAPPDNLSFDTVHSFLESTHEHYRSFLKTSFGSTVPGIFTDEPSLADRHAAFDPSRSWIPWSEGMEAYYQMICSKDVYESLPLLFFQGEGSFKVRHDYWHCISLRYEACYSKQIGLWCAEQNLSYTGHFLQEDKLGLCTRVNGSIMPHYTHQAMPGIDLLGERIDEYLTLKQVSSVAHQYGKSRVICETYAGCGWDFSFAGQKWVGDWQYVLGVTNRCPHLMLYSLRGNRKRDYPQSFNYHNVWWEKQYLVETYFARLSTILQQGEVQRPILLLHPMGTVWGRIGCSPYGNPVRRNERDVPKGDEIGYALNRLLKRLESAFLSVDLGDETLLQRDGQVVENTLLLKLASYQVVIVPRMETLFSSTFDLLEKFVQGGGKLVVLGSPPVMVEGEDSPSLQAFFTTPAIFQVSDKEQLLALLGQLSPPLIQASPQKPELHVQIRKFASLSYLFIVNTNRNDGVSTTLSTRLLGSLQEWDLLQGGQKELNVSYTDSTSMSWHISLPPAGSALYVIDGDKPVSVETYRPHFEESLRYTLLFSFPMSVTCSEDNALVLDRCRYSLEGEKWSEEAYTWEVQREIRSQLAMVRLDTDEVEQRYRWVSQPHPEDGKLLQLEYHFQVLKGEDSLCSLALEEPEHFAIMLNGTEVSSLDVGFYLDRSFKRIQLPKLQEGDNVLSLSCRYTNAMSLEDVYILGQFSVDSQRRLGKRISKLNLDSWTKQGLFHYAGSVTYHRDFSVPLLGKKALLSGGEFVGACMSVAINESVYEIPWQKVGELDVSSSLRKGKNHLSITVYGSPRNLLGPLHLKNKPDITNPASFFPPEELRTDSYQVVDVGLMKAPKLLIY